VVAPNADDGRDELVGRIRSDRVLRSLLVVQP